MSAKNVIFGCRAIFGYICSKKGVEEHRFSNDLKNTAQRKGELQIMSDKIIENNQVTIMGEVASPLTYSHEVFGEGFYVMDVMVKRLSNSEDRIPLTISERLIDVNQDYTGEFIKVSGQFRWYYPCLSVKWNLWMKNWMGQRQIISY